jgi:hypothetical protein
MFGCQTDWARNKIVSIFGKKKYGTLDTIGRLVTGLPALDGFGVEFSLDDVYPAHWEKEIRW